MKKRQIAAVVWGVLLALACSSSWAVTNQTRSVKPHEGVIQQVYLDSSKILMDGLPYTVPEKQLAKLAPLLKVGTRVGYVLESDGKVGVMPGYAISSIWIIPKR